MPRQVFLAVDKGREGLVIGFLERVFEDIRYVEQQINVGDYLICEPVPGGEARILACIERKSHADFAASINDGRYEGGRKKMRWLRDQCGCQLFWLMEGPAFPAPTRRFGKKGSGKPWESLHSAEINLMVRDGIYIMKTPNVMGTAQELYKLASTFRDKPTIYAQPGVAPNLNLAPQGGAEDAQVAVAQQQVPAQIPDEPFILAVPAIVKGRFEVSEESQIIQMWTKLRGVSLVVAEKFVRDFTVVSLVGGRPSFQEIGALKSPTGRAITKDAKASLRALQRGDPERARKIVGGIPGLGKAVAIHILETVGGLAPLCAIDVEVLAETRTPQKNRTVKLGAAKAARIKRFLKGEPQREGQEE
jgi:ERCC4-type nuclease